MRNELPSQEESSDVSGLAGTWLRCIVWVAALMLPFQLVLSNCCFCQCLQHETEETCDHGACDCCHNHAHESACDCPRLTADSEAGVALHPCDCPPECPCHFRAAPQPLAQPTIAKKLCTEKSYSIASFAGTTARFSAARVAIPVPALAENGSAKQNLCAVLCRFTI